MAYPHVPELDRVIPSSGQKNLRWVQGMVDLVLCSNRITTPFGIRTETCVREKLTEETYN